MRRSLISEETRKGTKYLMFSLIFLVIVVMAMFFLKASGSAQQGYELKQLQSFKKELEDENQELKMKLLEIKSTQGTEEEARKNMNPIEDPIYFE